LVAVVLAYQELSELQAVTQPLTLLLQTVAVVVTMVHSLTVLMVDQVAVVAKAEQEVLLHKEHLVEQQVMVMLAVLVITHLHIFTVAVVEQVQLATAVQA
jgi:hypothetical protein